MPLAAAVAFVTAASASTPNGAELQVVSRSDGPAGQESTTAYDGTTDASGGRVVFVSSSLDGRPAGIYLRDLGQARTRFLAEGAFPDLDASGTRLTFTRDGQLYALDLRSGASRLLSARHHGVIEKRRSGSSGPGSISGNGRYVAFSSTATDLLGRQEAKQLAGVLGRGQIYVRDLKTGKIELVSRAGGEGAIGDGESREPAISANGRYVAFTSTAGNLIPGAPNHQPAIYLRDLRTGATRLVSHFARGGAQHRTAASQPTLSADGRYVCFELNQVGRPPVIVVRDLRSRTYSVPSAFAKVPVRLPPFARPTISADGRFVAYRGTTSDNGLTKLYLADLSSRRSRIVGRVGSQGDTRLDLSAKGRFLVFDTYVQNVPGRGSLEPVTESGEVYRLRNPLRSPSKQRGLARPGRGRDEAYFASVAAT